MAMIAFVGGVMPKMEYWLSLRVLIWLTSGRRLGLKFPTRFHLLDGSLDRALTFQGVKMLKDELSNMRRQMEELKTKTKKHLMLLFCCCNCCCYCCFMLLLLSIAVCCNCCLLLLFATTYCCMLITSVTATAVLLASYCYLLLLMLFTD